MTPRPYVVTSPSLFRVEHLSPADPSEQRVASFLAECHGIRRRIFVEEQGVPSEIEWDDLDPVADHFLAFDRAGPRAVGTARLRMLENYAKAERVAVISSARARGVGRALMSALEEVAHDHDLEEIRLSAQITALPFYLNLDYCVVGEVFEEAGIPHQAMCKRLGADEHPP